MLSSHNFEVVRSGETWAKARGLKERNLFTQWVVQQEPNVWLHLGLLYKKGVTNQRQDVIEYAGYDLGNSSNDRRDTQYAA